jgi:hypothetical protein
VGFEVVDENGDGVNEPGEHLLVRKIYVQNTGGMPSPTQSRIPVLIHGGMWLDPIQEPVYLPLGIQPGETVEVPGVLRAFIQQERSQRPMGVKFSATDEIKLIGVMPGINRVLPDFCGSTSIKIAYPLELEAPRYLNSVERGNNVTFSWVVSFPGQEGIILLVVLLTLSRWCHSYEMSAPSHMVLEASWNAARGRVCPRTQAPKSSPSKKEGANPMDWIFSIHSNPAQQSRSVKPSGCLNMRNHTPLVCSPSS